MRIATWNVNDINKRLPILLAWLETTRPDAVALQELKSTESNFPRAELERAGYQCLVVGQPAWNGVALLARGPKPVEIRRVLPGDPSDKQARYLEAAIGGVIVTSIYLPNGNPQPGPKFTYKLAWFERLITHAAALWQTGHPVVLAGDYNVVNALLKPAPREDYARLVAQGWTDALRAMHPKDAVYTFWDYRRNRWQRNAGLRIDHLLLSKAVQPRLRSADVDREVRALADTSDHAPVWIELT
jgi:exodeoxyribonuclease-3